MTRLRRELKVPAQESQPTDQAAEALRPYFKIKRELEEIRSANQALFLRILSMKVERDLPQSGLVQLIDSARPARSPVRPNKPLNIVFGLWGGFWLSFLAGAGAVWLALRVAKNSPEAPSSSLQGQSPTRLSGPRHS